MIDVKTVDARGLSCPEPVLLARKALQELIKGRVDVLVDSGTARENVSRMAKHSGWTVKIEEQADGSCRMELKK